MSTLQECADDILSSVKSMSRFSPDGYSAFHALMNSLNSRGATSPASRALFGAAMGVAGCCEHCARRNAHAAADAGATEQEIKLALQRGVLMASGPATIVAAHALDEFRQASIGRRENASNTSIISKTRSNTSAGLLLTSHKRPAVRTSKSPTHEAAIH